MALESRDACTRRDVRLNNRGRAAELLEGTKVKAWIRREESPDMIRVMQEASDLANLEEDTCNKDGNVQVFRRETGRRNAKYKGTEANGR